ncbi:cytochrome P450 [Hypoxylon rubiginosum]|uniref:Cytochrome P450 n=1 Tax=Hypoxylon rubiginosum TaxID=110542 RepID=A0ACB9YGF1_9PEZI|nr:cytochrome P450 [Hypoxylon rubiginosum]
MGMFSAMAFNAVGAIVLLGVLALTYRLLLHPLSDYPGPLVAKLTDGYGGYHASRKRLHLATYHDHLKYGPVFRQAPNRLIFNTAAALHDIYLNPEINKAHIYKQTQFNPEKNIFGTLDRERHKQKRKVYGQILSDRSLRTFEPTMRNEIDVFLRQLLKAHAEPVNMTPLCERLATDIAGQLAFGQPLNTQTDATNRIFPRSMISMNAVVSFFMAWPAISLTWPLLSRLNKKNGLMFGRALRGIVQARMALPKGAKHDFYSIAAEDVGEGEEGLRRSEIWAEAVFFLPAGGTTISAALSAIFFYLSRHPTVYARLAREIRTTFSSGSAIQGGPQMSGCKYLRAVIDETMRVAPPFVGTFWREPYSSHTKPFVVDGHVIPRGVLVGVNPYCLMHNEAYFPEPFAFRPERWLGPADGTSESPEAERARSAMRGAFAPFASGDTGCLGKAMAYYETSLVVAKTLWYFDFEKAPGEAGRLGEGEPGRKDGRHRTDEYQLFDLAVADHDGPNLVFKPRAGYWKELEVD